MAHELQQFLTYWQDPDGRDEHRQSPWLASDKNSRDWHSPVEKLEIARPRFAELIRNMAPDIEAGRWDVIVGDDVSGRTGTLLVQRVIDRVYRDRGYPTPPTFFLALGRDLQGSSKLRQQLAEYVSQADHQFNRALFVTDNIGEGNTIHFACGLLHNAAHLPADVASFVEDSSVADVCRSVSRITGDTDLRTYSTNWQSWADRPELHGGTYLPRLRRSFGVEKYDDSPITESRRAHDIRAAHAGKLAVDHSIPINPDVAAVRHKIEEMADDIYEEVFGKKS